jgi:hypothetical protein
MKCIFDMDRKEFIKRALMATISVAGISLPVLSISKNACENISVPIGEAQCLEVEPLVTHFKISSHKWKQFVSEDNGSYAFKALDEICIKLCGSPMKEVGFMDDDFVNDVITVHAFSLRDDNYNGKAIND